MKKSELYSNIIDIQKKTGQGLTGIVGLRDIKVQKLLDELVAEGVIKLNIKYYNHMPNDYWYSPATGYCVWDDEDRHALSYVRIYVGAKDILFGFKDIDIYRNADFMKRYSKWIKKHEDELKIMLDLNDVYMGNDVSTDDFKEKLFTDDDISFIKSKAWYKENLTLSICLDKSNDMLDNYKQHNKISKEILDLYKIKDDENEIRKTKSDIERNKVEIKIRTKIKDYLNTLDGSTLIQDVDFNV